MAERKFVILKYRDKVPALASCAKCQLNSLPPQLIIVILLERQNTCSANLIVISAAGRSPARPLTRNEYLR
jgi:hypothetical protein